MILIFKKEGLNMTKVNDVKNLVIASMLLAIGVIMPYAFHFAGSTAGQIFLPLYWSIGLTGLILPLKYGLMVAVLLPIISHLSSGMPAVPILYFMLIELVFYVLFTYLFSKKFNSFISLTLSLILCRGVYVLSIFIAAEFLGLPAPYAGIAVLITTIATSIPGIVCQIIILPTLEKIYHKVIF